MEGPAVAEGWLLQEGEFRGAKVVQGMVRSQRMHVLRLKQRYRYVGSGMQVVQKCDLLCSFKSEPHRPSEARPLATQARPGPSLSGVQLCRNVASAINTETS